MNLGGVGGGISSYSWEILGGGVGRGGGDVKEQTERRLV